MNYTLYVCIYISEVEWTGIDKSQDECPVRRKQCYFTIYVEDF